MMSFHSSTKKGLSHFLQTCCVHNRRYTVLATMTTTPNAVDNRDLNTALANDQTLPFNSVVASMVGMDHDMNTFVSDLSETSWDGKEKKGSKSTDQSDDSSNRSNDESNDELVAQFQRAKTMKADMEKQLEIESCRLNELLDEFNPHKSSNLLREEIKYQNVKVRDTQKDFLVCETTIRQIVFRLHHTSK
mmetsp:Transcript_32286/g.78774  ORF Transcript_32286/g.78774 Transcript_32286/m.78774 type:complete len:190 (-) Transcript_32286:2083-2652(-)